MRLLLFLLSVALVFVVPTLSAAERILSFHSDIRVLDDGSMIVTETIRVIAEGNQIRRGIYRDFPTQYRDRLGNHYRVDFEILGVARDGADEPYHSETRSNGVRVYIGRSDSLLAPGAYSYELEYATDRQIGFFEQHDELYWNVTGNGWGFPIEEASASVQLPASVPAAQLAVEGYTGPQGSTQRNYSVDVADGAARIATTSSLAPREGLTLVLAWPKGIVQAPSKVQRLGYVLRDNAGLLLGLSALVGSAVYLLLMWHRYGRDPDAGVVFPHYEPPPGYSPASLRYVKRMGYDTATFTAAIVNLAVKGYVEISTEKKFLGFGTSYTLTRKPSEEPLARGERAILDKLFVAGGTLQLDNEQHAIVSSARSAHSAALKKDYRGLYFKTNGMLLLPSVMLSLLLFVLMLVTGAGVPLAFLAFVGALLLHGLFLWLMKAPSERGRRLLDKSAGFKLYLEVAEKDELNLRNPPQKTPQLFEAYLPYAIALGVEQAWAEQFSRVFAQLAGSSGAGYQPNWYHGDFNAMRMGSFSTAVGSGLNSAISSAAKAPGSSSGGGGGFSGGGGGGGGGGGW